MRLLVAESIRDRLAIVDFTSPESRPHYAILSHTWTDDEVLLTDVEQGTATSRRAYPKVRAACEQALEDGFEHVWIDTCCIDKTSSAELSEAINSMFDWYRRAGICYAYLSDLYSDTHEGVQALAQSRWFTRGFTLQELIAPSHVVFYAGDDWRSIGDKASLSGELAHITRIDKFILMGQRNHDTASVANRMGWAAGRRTTRPEDVAYCLMGLFNVNMPLLYGEGGRRAFGRLQEEIMKRSTDHSLFVWIHEGAPDYQEYGLLAPSPSCFARTSHMVPYQQWETRLPYFNTAAGLSIQLPLIQVWQDDSRTVQGGGQGRGQGLPGSQVFYAVLDCPPLDFRNGHFAAVFLLKTGTDGRHFARIRASTLSTISHAELMAHGDPRRQIYVLPSPEMVAPEVERMYPWHYICVETIPPADRYHVLQIWRVCYAGDAPILETASRPGLREQGEHIAASLGLVEINREPLRMSLVMLLEQRHPDQRRLVITVGVAETLHLAFSAHELGGREMPPAEMLQDHFVPSLMYKSILLPSHSVRVGSHRRIDGMSKIYHLSIEATPVSLPPESDAPSTVQPRASRFRRLLRLPGSDVIDKR